MADIDYSRPPLERFTPLAQGHGIPPGTRAELSTKGEFHGGLRFASASSSAVMPSGHVSMQNTLVYTVTLPTSSIEAQRSWENGRLPYVKSIVFDLGTSFDYSTYPVSDTVTARNTAAKVVSAEYARHTGDGEFELPVADMMMSGIHEFHIKTLTTISAGRYRVIHA